MDKQKIMFITAGVFISFLLLLSAGMAIDAKDEARDLRWEQSDLESRMDRLEDRR